MAFVSTGLPGRIGDVHIDVIVGYDAPQAWSRTTVALEDGTPVGLHRNRDPRLCSVEILISDVAPVAGAILFGGWELQHAQRTRERLEALAAAGTAVVFFDGREFVRPPSGRRAWIIDSIDPEIVPDEQTLTVQTYRATIILGELPRFSTDFTTFVPDVDPSVQDVTDGVVDNGQQSTEQVPDDVASGVSLG